MRKVVNETNACALEGVTIKYDTFIPYMWHAVDMGYVDVRDAMFVGMGLRWGFGLELDHSKLKGRRVFRNYPPARKHRGAVTEAMGKRVEKGKTVLVGEWGVDALSSIPFDDYVIFPMGVVDKCYATGKSSYSKLASMQTHVTCSPFLPQRLNG